MLFRSSKGTTDDEFLVRAFETGLAESGIQPDVAFHSARSARPLPMPFATFAEQVALYAPVEGAVLHPYWNDATPCTMLVDEVEAIWAAIAERDDWAPLDAKVAAVRRMGAAHR